MRNKKVLYIMIGLVMIYVLYYCTSLFFNPTEFDIYKEEVDFINNNSIDLVIYGDDIAFPGEVNHRKVNGISEEIIYPEISKDYTIIILNDLSGDLPLTHSDIYIIKELLIEQRNILGMLYYGQDKVEMFFECDFFECTPMFSNELHEYVGENFGFEIRNSKNIITPFVDNWTRKKNDELVDSPYLLFKNIHFAFKCTISDNS